MDILKAANWIFDSTFCQLYSRPSSTSKFGQAVLSNRQISGELQTIPCSKLHDYVVVMYLESLKCMYNYRFPKDRKSDWEG